VDHSWQKELGNSLRSIADINLFFGTNLTIKAPNSFSALIPLPLAKKIQDLGPSSALWKQFIPQDIESEHFQESGSLDPIGDSDFKKTNCLIHRYHNRVLFLPTHSCPVHCRYCFRRNVIDTPKSLSKSEFELCLEYLKEHVEVEEIIFSGGDPLVLSDSKIQFYLEQFATLPNIKFIRFHTRTPVILPSRLNLSLASVLEKFQGRFHINLVLHINHASEIDQTLLENLRAFNRQGVELLSQTVLLNGVNTYPEDLALLFKTLSMNRIKPYYLHHPDRVSGGLHFYLPIEQGRKIYLKLRSMLSGWMIPQYVIDQPSGRGKLPIFNAENFEFSGKLLGLSGTKESHTES
jgi:lysine 2,3-aminomutase